MHLLTYALTTVVIFVGTVVAMRLLGKTAIVQLTPYDLATIVLLGTVLAEPLVTTNVLRAFLAALVIILAHSGFARLTLTSWGGRLLLGEPTIVVKHGKIVEDNLEQSGTSVAQLLALLRSAGYPRVQDVEYAILEPIGQLTVIPKGSRAPVTPADLNLPERYVGLPLPLIVDGSIKTGNLKLIGKDRGWLLQVLASAGYATPDIIYAGSSDSNRLFVNLRDGRAEEIVLERGKPGQA